MPYSKTLGILKYARYLYEQERMPILQVFDTAAEAQGADKKEEAEAIRIYVWAMPQPKRVMKIEDMLVEELIEGFNAAIKLTEEWQNDPNG